MDREAFLREFHAAHAGATSRAFSKTGSYARLAAMVAGRTRVLDLACGDRAMPGAIGVDLSMDELALGASNIGTSNIGASNIGASNIGASNIGASNIGASNIGASNIGAVNGARVQARAQALPFRDGAFDACVCHLAFMLFDDIERVVAELARVIEPGGVFVALLGGGPVEGVDDAFHRFLEVARPQLGRVALGDSRARSERGWRQLFAGWSEPAFERVELELGGSFDDAWTFLGASYQLDPAAANSVRAKLRDQVGERVSCRVACWIASVTR